MKTILFILPDLNMGGAERIITLLINNLDKNKFTPKLLLMRKEGYYLELLDKNIEIIDIKTSRIRNAFFPIVKALRKLKPDIVFGGWGEVSAYLAPIIPFFPKIRFIARETNIVSQHVTRPEIRFFYRFYNNFDTIIAQSDDMKNDLINNLKIREKKIIKINNPVDVDAVETKSLEPMNFPFSEGFKNVVAIGNLSYRKGFDNLLKVFSYLKNENIFLYIIGEGDDKEKLIELKDSLQINNVKFLGKITNPYPYLKNADLFILSSRYEGFPNVLLEAGAAGTFSLANNCKGGINEIIEENVNGRIISIEDHKNFAEEIKITLSKKYDKNRIKNSIKNRFSKDKIIYQYEKILEANKN
ncbi:glycosyltransferase [Apibacter sp. B2912]|uniref:glycosyltransferase n=1 Tax=Apibacter sp. B2912 TaxID=2656763 RepID=UPI001371D176|nr:glycosyltransferase [Apibacter sp. B2912]MXO32956.1 glycosyltransferase [Apibacter sp. B2912]